MVQAVHCINRCTHVCCLYAGISQQRMWFSVFFFLSYAVLDDDEAGKKFQNNQGGYF